MVNEPVFLTAAQKEFRVPLMVRSSQVPPVGLNPQRLIFKFDRQACLNVETNQVGYCCRDPFYEDPWPGGMMMPNMAKPPPPPPVAPSIIESPAQTVPVVQCPDRLECVPQATCASRFGAVNMKSVPVSSQTRRLTVATFNDCLCQQPCRNSAGNPGVCCNRAPPPPPPPPPTPAPYYPPASSPPPRRPEQNYLPPPPPTQPVVVPTTPPPPPPPPTPPPTSYLPPPVPPKEPVVAPSTSYIPPPPPAPAAQTADFQECGVTRALTPSSNDAASLGEFPWQGLVMFDNGTMTCSAALVGQKFALTSAHCVRG